MQLCIRESLTFWHTLPSKRCPVCIHTEQRFDGQVYQKVKLLLEPNISYIHTHINIHIYLCSYV